MFEKFGLLEITTNKGQRITLNRFLRKFVESSEYSKLKPALMIDSCLKYTQQLLEKLFDQNVPMGYGDPSKKFH